PDWPSKYFHKKTAQEIMSVLSFKNMMNNYLLSAFYGSIAIITAIGFKSTPIDSNPHF
ncbi:unnamed protein product, partial [marine sediment metagenome]